MRCEAAESAGHSLALAPWGLQRVRRRSLEFFWRPRGHTCDRWVDKLHGRGPVSPRVPTAKVLPFLFGEGHVRAKNRLNVRRTPDPRLVCSQRITCTMCVQGKVRIRTPRNEAMSWGSPGVRNSHAGKYGELTPLRQRGGAGYDLPLTH